jgi:hypothetical protein
MAKPKGEEILRKQKEAKQKKLLMILGPVFLALMVWQGPGYIKMLTGGEEAAAPAPASETPVPTTPDPGTAPPPSTSDPGGGAPVPAAGEGTVGLADSDQPTAPDAGQLIAFDRFVGKDPFKQMIDTSQPATDSPPTVTPVPTSPGGGGGGGAGTDPGGSGGGGGDDDEPAKPVAAVLEVNGVEDVVKVGDEFPKGENLFVLTRLTRGSAWIGLVTGEFSNGQDAIEVDAGDSLNLVSQPDGIRYTIDVVAIRVR